VSEKVAVFGQVITKLKDIAKTNVELVKNEEDIGRMKTSVELVSRDIN
jgi:hypothetical protein